MDRFSPCNYRFEKTMLNTILAVHNRKLIIGSLEFYHLLNLLTKYFTETTMTTPKVRFPAIGKIFLNN